MCLHNAKSSDDIEVFMKAKSEAVSEEVKKTLKNNFKDQRISDESWIVHHSGSSSSISKISYCWGNKNDEGVYHLPFEKRQVDYREK